MQIDLSVPAGPGLERLQAPATLRALRAELARHAGQDIEISVAAASGETGAGGRITEDSVRDGRLRRLVEQEPGLREAVEELDLELLE